MVEQDAYSKHFFESEFTTQRGIKEEMRTPRAAEYAAFHLGQINRKLDRIIELLEKQATTG